MLFRVALTLAVCSLSCAIASASPPLIGQSLPSASASAAAEHLNWETRLRAHLDPARLQSLDIVDALPDLLPQTLSHTERAFNAAGWPAAKTTLDNIVRSQLSGRADDNSILGCVRAWDDIFRTLRLAPEQCRAAILQGYKGVTVSAAASVMEDAGNACTTASENGFWARKRGLHFVAVNEAAYHYYVQASLVRPELLSGDERAAVDDPAHANATTACEARLKQDRNIQAFGGSVAAAFYRGSYQFESRNDAIITMNPPRRWPPTPPDFKCPAPGTRFRLSLTTFSGQPVVWTSLGTANFDCRMKSSVSGERGLWASLELEHPARPINNAIRALWPLAVGKIAYYAYHPAIGDDEETEDKVTGYGLHPFMGGQIPAYEITLDTFLNGGERRYAIVKYWAPALGWIIGQKTVVFRGPRPDGVAPDWMVWQMHGPAYDSH